MYRFKRNDIVVLLGAGASVDAGIPNSTQMIEKVEILVGGGEWQKSQDLYHCVRSAIHYGDGIKGRTGTSVSYNIERLVGTLDELAKRDEHPLYPFVGAWSPKLMEVAGANFGEVVSLKNQILMELRDKWLAIQRYEEQAVYYEGLVRFQREYEHSLRVFSLNYDLCVEKAFERCHRKYPERGFESRRWDWRLFDDNPNDFKEMFLYKLHGSVDWKKVGEGDLTYVDTTSSIPVEHLAIIFGVTYKLQYVDPFLFLAYELRKWTLESKLIVCVGYGFGDEHVNGILGQALRNNPDRTLLSVTPFVTEALSQDDQEGKIRIEKHRIAELLKIKKPDQITCWNHTGEEFMTKYLSLTKLAELFPRDEELFPETTGDKIATSESTTAS